MVDQWWQFLHFQITQSNPLSNRFNYIRISRVTICISYIEYV
uniref:Uncharacterized protein n=1 Tax=Rhizophora mucronata TaxID=61149 RepID=A0A2P2NZ01_RHIMU